MAPRATTLVAALALLSCSPTGPRAPDEPSFRVTEDPERIRIEGPALRAAVRKKGYVTGIEAGSFRDARTGFRDAGFGLHIVDWIMEPGSDAAYRDRLEGDLPYDFGNLVHGNRPKRSIEGPQICTRAGELSPSVHGGPDFVAVEAEYVYRIAAPGRSAGSTWRQRIVFPRGKRWFLSSDEVTAVNASACMFLRIDMPGHIRHDRGDTFSEVYLSYHGRIPASEFLTDFAPDARFLYERKEGEIPRRFIRAYRLRDPATGKDGPWLAGMTLDPAAVHEAWCHQRGYVCMIEEIGGRPIRPGDSFGAAYLVGFFDSIEDMEAVYDDHAGATGIEIDTAGWKLVRR
jgi:hypothetical protein